MIKFFQKLKAKKGFTLVELIVVIAIIGVLAAILIPTMLNYVTNSRVTSANSTAASIKNNIDTFLTECDTAGYGMKQGSNFSTLTITITPGASGAAPTWAVTAATNGGTAFKGPTGKWGTTAGSATTATNKTVNDSAEQLLAIELCKLFPEIEQGAIFASLAGGKCMAVAYTADQSSLATADYPAIVATTGKWDETTGFDWDGKTDGVSDNGIIVGTAPAYVLG